MNKGWNQAAKKILGLCAPLVLIVGAVWVGVRVGESVYAEQLQHFTREPGLSALMRVLLWPLAKGLASASAVAWVFIGLHEFASWLMARRARAQVGEGAAR